MRIHTATVRAEIRWPGQEKLGRRDNSYRDTLYFTTLQNRIRWIGVVDFHFASRTFYELAKVEGETAR